MFYLEKVLFLKARIYFIVKLINPEMFKLSAGLNLETFDTILSRTSHI